MNSLPVKGINTGRVEKFTDLKRMLKYGLENYADLTYLSYKNSENELENISYRMFSKMVDGFGTGLYKLGLMGARIALLAETRYEWLVTNMAVINGNGVIVPLDREVSHEQLLNFIELSESECVVYSDSYAELIEEYAKSGRSKVKLFINMDITENKSDVIYSFDYVRKSGEKGLAEGCGEFVSHKVDNSVMCSMLFTSGTTGTSKAVMLSHKNWASVVYGAACYVCGIHRGDVILSVLPAHHTYETSCTFFTTYALGTTVCINESLKTVSKNFLFFKPNKMVLVPMFIDTIVKKIWDGIEKKGQTKKVKAAIKLSNALRKVGIDIRRQLFGEIIAAFGGRLSGCISGGAPLNPSHISTLDSFGIEIWQGYGTTECAPLISVVPYGMHMKKIGSVGYPIPSMTVKIDKSPGGEYGEILVKGDNVMLGYTDEEETRKVMTEDGYYRTGDIGYLDEDGYIYITGRKKNIIILSNGKNIYPEEIEEYLYKCEFIKECAVISRKKEGGEPLLTALIYPDYDKFSSVSDAEPAIKAEVLSINKKLPSFKHINHVEIRETEFEKTTSKKIIRYKLK